MNRTNEQTERELKSLREENASLTELSKLQGAMLSVILAEKKSVAIKRKELREKIRGKMNIKKTKNSYILEFEE